MSIVLNNRFELQEAIDEGGMSIVYRAWCRKTKSIVAVKVLRPEFADNPVYVRAFRQEAYTVAKLHHRNIVHIIDVGVWEKYRYLAMEYVSGSTLKKKIEEEGHFSVEECVNMGLTLCNALNYAHHKGIIHKDLKPANILLNLEGEPILTDFGIAEEMSEVKEKEKEVFGSVHYFSPEQAKGDPVDRRTDIYSMGIILYELATGQLPFTGEDNLSIALKHLHMRPVEPRELNPEIPESLNRIILKAISKNREDRYASAADMFRDLEICLVQKDGKYIELSNEYEYRFEQHALHSRRMRVLGLALSLTGVVALFLVIFFSIFGSLGIFTGEKTIYMPTLTERTLSEAKKVMEELDIDLEVSYEPNVQVQRGYVVSQDPETGAVLKKGDTVSVVVSSGATYAKSMPNLVGLTQEQAMAELDALDMPDLHIDVLSEQSDKDEPGAVIQQQPAPEEPVDKDTNVTIVINVKGAAAQINVPNLVGQDMRQAVSKAKQAGFTSVWLYPTERDAEPYKVLDQSPTIKELSLTNTVMKLMVQPPKSGKNVSGSLAWREKVQKNSTITVTISYKIDDTLCEFAVFDESFKDDADFQEKYNGKIMYALKVENAHLEEVKKLTVYVNGQAAHTENI